MPKFSANLGFLWTDLSLPEAILAAKHAGFDAVECHYPYSTPTQHVKNALIQSGLPMLSLNTSLGQKDTNDFGVMAIAGREQEAQMYVDEAIQYALKIKSKNIHCLAGKTDGSAKAETIFRHNLKIACEKAEQNNIGILIEAINHRDVPNYHLTHIEKGIETIQNVDSDNIKLMFDCYHTQIMQGDLLQKLKVFLPFIGHIQFAAVHDRGEPDSGEIDYPWLFKEIDKMGWNGYFGAEYRPRTTTDEGLSWLNAYK